MIYWRGGRYRDRSYPTSVAILWGPLTSLLLLPIPSSSLGSFLVRIGLDEGEELGRSSHATGRQDQKQEQRMGEEGRGRRAGDSRRKEQKSEGGRSRRVKQQRGEGKEGEIRPGDHSLGFGLCLLQSDIEVPGKRIITTPCSLSSSSNLRFWTILWAKLVFWEHKSHSQLAS